MKKLYVLFIAVLFVSASIKFLSKNSLLSLGLTGMGALSIWTGCFYYYTKQNIPRRFEPPIDFRRAPKEHTSSVSAFVVLGLFFVGMGIHGFVRG